MRKLILLIIFPLLPLIIFSQSDTTEQKTKIKTGWNFAGLPVVGYDADMGFQYGLLGSAYYFGDGLTYPEYRHMFYAEVSRFTRGSGVNQFFYDSKYLLPWDMRITLDVSYLTDKAINFYGFNGFQAAYFPEFEDEDSEDYISRMYYRHERKLWRVMLDLQKPIPRTPLRALLGFSYFNIKTDQVDVDNLNKGKSEDKQIPDTILLYDDYISSGNIMQNELTTGNVLYLKFGLVLDTRDNEPAPNRGLWSEALILTAPSFMGNNHAFTRLAITHRHYITLVNDKLVLAYRLGYQGTIGGTAPFYILPYMYYSFSRSTKSEGLGGARTLRGILRNRIVGDGIAFGNIELRWKFARTTIFKQNFYFGLYGFLDGGQVVQERPVDKYSPPTVGENYWDQDHDSFHISYGLGLRIAMNENFILVVDYGIANDPRDGKSGFYVGVGNSF